MLEIKLFDEKEASILENFNSREWPSVDQEHYLTQQTDFSREKFKFIAWDKEIIAGYISIFIDTGVASIESLIVGKNYRRIGLATKLVSYGEEEAKRLGAHKIKLETGVDWKARKLYEKLGYKVRTFLPNYYAHNDFVLMDKDL